MTKTNDLMIVFSPKNSIGYFDIENQELIRIDGIEKNHFIYEHIKPPFDWYFHDDIMIIPDPIPSPRKKWNKTITVANQVIKCTGQYIVFYHFKERNDLFNFASSLTLPEFEYLKSNLIIN
ncbi:hypothetical protein [Enterococcus olivae]